MTNNEEVSAQKVPSGAMCEKLLYRACEGSSIARDHFAITTAQRFRSIQKLRSREVFTVGGSDLALKDYHESRSSSGYL